MGESGNEVATPHDHVVSEERRQAIGAECHGVLEGEDYLAKRMDPPALGSTIGGAHNLAIERCVNFCSPGVAVAGRYTDEESAKDPSGVVAESAPRVDHEQVVGESLAEH